jgi:hypothetical protein
MPLLARDEYVLKTAVGRLHLNARTLREREDLMTEARGAQVSTKRFQIASAPH